MFQHPASIFFFHFTCNTSMFIRPNSCGWWLHAAQELIAIEEVLQNSETTRETRWWVGVSKLIASIVATCKFSVTTFLRGILLPLMLVVNGPKFRIAVPWIWLVTLVHNILTTYYFCAFLNDWKKHVELLKYVCTHLWIYSWIIHVELIFVERSRVESCFWMVICTSCCEK